MRTLTAESTSNLATINTRWGMQDPRVSITLARIIADIIPMSTHQEQDIERYYRLTHYPKVKKVISDLHDIVFINHMYVEELIINFYRLRNGYIHPTGIPSDFWGCDVYLDKKTLMIIDKNKADLHVIGNLMNPVVLELFN